MDIDFGNLAQGEFGEARAAGVRSAIGARGPRGETLLHWALFWGEGSLAKRLLSEGVPSEPDNFGNHPIHWLASSGGMADMLLQKGQAAGEDGEQGPMAPLDGEMASLLAPGAGLPGFGGRDAMGLLCLRCDRKGLIAFCRAFPAAAAAGARLGVGGALSAGDAMAACRLGWSGNARFDEEVAALGLPPASLEIPEALAAAGGMWTPELWRSGLEAVSGPLAWARAEAAAVGRACSDAPKGSAPRRI